MFTTLFQTVDVSCPFLLHKLIEVHLLNGLFRTAQVKECREQLILSTFDNLKTIYAANNDSRLLAN